MGRSVAELAVKRALGIVLVAAVLSVAACGTTVPTRTYPPGTADISIAPFETGTPAPSAAAPSAAVVQASVPAGPLTIVALGDSLTEGQGDDSGQGGYPGRLARLVEQARPGSKIVNVGHSGWSSQDLIEGANGEASELTRALDGHPNVALVWIGSNDLWYLYEFGPEPMTDQAEQADLATFGAHVDTILSRLTGQGAVVLIALLDDQSKRPVVADPPNPRELAFPATTRADLALMSKHVAAYNDVIRASAARYGAATVDFSGSAIFTDAETLYGDGNHPNEAGYDAVTQVWWEVLAPLLG